MAELVIALDVREQKDLDRLVSALKGKHLWMKLGMEALSSFGLEVIDRIHKEGFRVFADVKYHDIPNTVGAASRVLTRTGAAMFNVHCTGGEAMCDTARRESGIEAERHGMARPLVLGVTVLTSLSQEDLVGMGVAGTPREAAMRLAGVAYRGGLDGVVASVHEAAAIKEAFGPHFKVLTPGIRLSGADRQDQKRVATPADAVAAGSDYLVVGRPITKAEDPAAACESILEEMNG